MPVSYLLFDIVLCWRLLLGLATSLVTLLTMQCSVVPFNVMQCKAMQGDVIKGW